MHTTKAEKKKQVGGFKKGGEEGVKVGGEGA